MQIDHIQSIGGNTEKESTKIILFHIIDKDVAIRYSRRGRGKLRKLPLEKTTFYKCLKRMSYIVYVQITVLLKFTLHIRCFKVKASRISG